VTTILRCHLRWKGEEDTNPCACILVQCLRREVDDHLDRWRYGGYGYRPPSVGETMARRKQSNMEPAVMTLNFDLGDTPVSYIDLSQCASIVNRRFYRQGLNWAVAGFRFGFEGAGVNVRVATLPNTWSISGAWQKAMRHWQRQQDEALESSGSEDSKGRFNDFKVYADTIHRTFGSAANQLPTNPGGFVANTDYLLGEEWWYSQIVIPNDGAPGVTNEYLLTMLGPDGANSKGVLQGYVESRNVPQSPDPEGPAVKLSFLQEMFDVGQNLDDVTDNAQFRNDELPYDQDLYPNQVGNASSMPTHREISFTGTTIGAHQNMDGCNVPCGLIQVAHNHVGEPNTLTMQVMLIPGTHRGYLAESMVDM